MRAVLMSIAVLTVGAVTGAGAAAAEPAPAALSADQLTAKLQRVINTGLSDPERAGELQGGLAAIPTANGIAAQMNRYGSMFSWNVQDAALNGDRLDAQLAVTVPLFGTRTHPLVWVSQDGAWKLSNASACVIATQVAGTQCTV